LSHPLGLELGPDTDPDVKARLERLELPTRLDDPRAAVADLVDDLVLVGNDGHRLQDAEGRFEGLGQRRHSGHSTIRFFS